MNESASHPEILGNPTPANAAPLVSVVVPAFNAAAVIGETFDSVRRQTFRNFEVVIVDDGSTDNTAAVAQKFCGLDARFVLLQQPNGGISAARNTAIARARGKWISFLDADDIWFPEKLVRQIELSKADPRANFLFANLHFWDGQKDLHLLYEDDVPLPEGDILRQLISDCRFLPSAIMVPRETLLAAGGFDTGKLRISEDWDMWLRLAERGLWARGIREPLGRYRRWPGSFSMNRLHLVETNVRVLEKHLASSQREDLRPLYRRSLAWAKASREIARVRAQAEKNPSVLPAAVWRAWRHQRRLKWLKWYCQLVWPGWLGGRIVRRSVHRKIFQRWPA